MLPKRLLSALRRKRNENRLRRLEFYKDVPDATAIQFIDTRTLIDLNRSFIYSRIPKSANSTVVASLRATGEETISRDQMEKVLKIGDIRPSQLTEECAREIKGTFFKFTVVRNPFTRVVSAYLDKIDRETHVGQKFRRSIGLSVEDNISFDYFLNSLLKEKILFLDAHWAPQVSLLAFPLECYDFIGSVENLNNDLKSIKKHLGMTTNRRDYVPHKTESWRFNDLVGPEQREKILEIYKIDFEYFNYIDCIS